MTEGKESTVLIILRGKTLPDRFDEQRGSRSSASTLRPNRFFDSDAGGTLFYTVAILPPARTLVFPGEKLSINHSRDQRPIVDGRQNIAMALQKWNFPCCGFPSAPMRVIAPPSVALSLF